MLHDLDWMYKQSGVIPVRFQEGNLQVLLITSRRKKHWVIPKGIVEGDLTPQESAAQEAYEEAGIRGSIESVPLGNFQYKKWGGICRVEVFLMQVEEELETWPEAYFRERKWLDLDSAQAWVDIPGLKKLLAQVNEHVKNRRTQTDGC